jgi:hypothetical protein
MVPAFFVGAPQGAPWSRFGRRMAVQPARKTSRCGRDFCGGKQPAKRQRSLRAGPHTVGRVPGIDRVSILANVAPIVSVLERRLQAIMAGFAKRSDRAHQEQIVIAAVCREMVGDGGGRDLTLRPAEAAQRIGTELMLRPTTPSLHRVPISDLHRLGRGERALRHGRQR